MKTSLNIDRTFLFCFSDGGFNDSILFWVGRRSEQWFCSVFLLNLCDLFFKRQN